ncbi:2-hydroxyacid dehydrogenase [Paludibacterium yongneupense]|uniref:2-hydroxyacid dehydrogenase n=1 Tax=Paludibacterium yongneupense TaxID=400061 RepID=UPI000424FBC6|nr:D-glycerate dehydrogenase [Paludibacterium yongneupense]
MPKRVVVYRALPPDLLAELEARFDVSYFPRVTDENRAAFMAATVRANGLIGSTLPLGEAELGPASELEVVSTISVGYDSIDLEFLNRRGILLAHTPGVLTETTADTVFALILASARRIVELAGYVKAGRWRSSIGDALFGTDVHGKTLGLIGLGRIGMAVARRARLGFDMNIVYHNLETVEEAEHLFDARRLPLDALLGCADFVCVVLPLSPQTEKLIGAREFALMRPEAFFINGSRGRIVDEEALIDALRQGRIRGAGLDVFAREPLAADSPLPGMDNVVALPHIGSATHETRRAMARMAVDNLIAALEGRRPAALANPQHWRAGR